MKQRPDHFIGPGRPPTSKKDYERALKRLDKVIKEENARMSDEDLQWYLDSLAVCTVGHEHID